MNPYFVYHIMHIHIFFKLILNGCIWAPWRPPDSPAPILLLVLFKIKKNRCLTHESHGTLSEGKNRSVTDVVNPRTVRYSASRALHTHFRVAAHTFVCTTI